MHESETDPLPLLQKSQLWFRFSLVSNANDSLLSRRRNKATILGKNSSKSESSSTIGFWSLLVLVKVAV